ncbi:MAG: N-acetylmuramoyl-L-alanine amidase family protein [Candidatus Eiseniibacteriota bacterium]
MRPLRMSLRAVGVSLFALALVLQATAAFAVVRVDRVGRGTSENVATVELDGRPMMGANALARLINGTKYWRPDLKKLEIRNVRHSLRLTVDTPYVIVDEVPIRLGSPVRLYAGEVHVPLDIFPLALSGRFMPRAAWDPKSQRIVLFSQDPNLGPPSLSASGARTRLVLPITEPLEPQVLSARKSRFLIEVPGGVLSAVPGDSLPAEGLLTSTRFRREPGSILIELGVKAGARGYRVHVPTGQKLLEIELAPELPQGYVGFAPEYGAPPNRPLRVLILDPGHGGPDSGYVASGGLREKDLTLQLAKLLRERLRQRLPFVDVRLTREGDANPPAATRVEAANRQHGDLYLSLHFDGVPGTAARGVTATVTPPLGFDVETEFAAVEDPRRPGGVRPLGLVPWRDAAGRYASDSRGVAELLLAALTADGRAPAQLRQARVLPIEGANMPAVMLECGMLSNPEDRARLADPRGLTSLADVLSRALERYAGGGFWP